MWLLRPFFLFFCSATGKHSWLRIAETAIADCAIVDETRQQQLRDQFGRLRGMTPPTAIETMHQRKAWRERDKESELIVVFFPLCRIKKDLWVSRWIGMGRSRMLGFRTQKKKTRTDIHGTSWSVNGMK